MKQYYLVPILFFSCHRLADPNGCCLLGYNVSHLLIHVSRKGNTQGVNETIMKWKDPELMTLLCIDRNEGFRFCGVKKKKENSVFINSEVLPLLHLVKKLFLYFYVILKLT